MASTSEKMGGVLLLVILLQLVSSTVLIYFGTVLVVFLEIDFLTFVSPVYALFPVGLLVVGSLIQLVSIFGFFATLYGGSKYLKYYSAFNCLAVIGEVLTVISALELRTLMKADGLSTVDVGSLLASYDDPTNPTRVIWDELQSNYRCCGGLTYTYGYQVWNSVPKFNEIAAVPDSCCLNPSPGCGVGVLDMLPGSVQEHIFVHGCLRIIEDLYAKDLVPALFAYAVVGAILSLMMISASALGFMRAIILKRDELQEELNAKLQLEREQTNKAIQDGVSEMVNQEALKTEKKKNTRSEAKEKENITSSKHEKYDGGSTLIN